MSALFPAPYIWTISLWQPWASLLFTAPRSKVHETRHWPLPAHIVGQTVLIHAAKHKVGALDPDLETVVGNVLGPLWREAVPYGAALGTLVMTGCRSTNAFQGWGVNSLDAVDAICGNFEPCRYAWSTDFPIALRAPVPMVGRQGWWKVPRDDLKAAA